MPLAEPAGSASGKSAESFPPARALPTISNSTRNKHAVMFRVFNFLGMTQKGLFEVV